MAAFMKAVRIHAFGDVDVLRYEDVERPEPQAGEVLVRVHAAGVNLIDAASRQQSIPVTTGAHALPYTLGWDISGEVVGVGKGVTAFAIGDEVYGMPRFPGEAAGVPLAGLTAWQALFDTANLQDGQTVFIPGGSGGVGHFAIQLAKWKGARVITTTSTRNIAFVRELGAHVVIDYTKQTLDNLDADLDVVLDMVGEDVLTYGFQALKPNGVIVSLLPWHHQLGEQFAAASGKAFVPISVHPSGEQLAALAELCDAGKLTTHLDAVFALQDVTQAHTLIEAGHVRGKVVVAIE